MAFQSKYNKDKYYKMIGLNYEQLRLQAKTMQILMQFFSFLSNYYY